MMRFKRNDQLEFNLSPSNLQVTNEYYAKYDAISQVLDENPEIVTFVHKDLARLEKKEKKGNQGRKPRYSSDTILRVVICQIVENESLRDIVVRIDDSAKLRWFVRIYNGPMMDYTTLCDFKNAIRPKTWKKIHTVLNRYAVEKELVDGERLRVDTTAYETNIHWPSDSTLLWDVYRVHARLIERVREIDPEVVGTKRLQVRRVKRLMLWIVRKAGKKKDAGEAVQERYEALFGLIEGVLGWSREIVGGLRKGLDGSCYTWEGKPAAEALIQQLEHFGELGLKVLSQAQRRILRKEKVRATEKIYSIFEPHTELLIRGKAGKDIEFGHMVLVGQVEGGYITDYDAFRKRPADFELVDPALENHQQLFGSYPEEFSADKGFYQNMEKIAELEEWVDVVSIAKKGKRNEQETERETSVAFKAGQRFRAGVEGSISFLKRALGLDRCRNKGWEHFVSTLGATVFVHNLLILARGFT